MMLQISMTLFLAQFAIAAQVRDILKRAKPAGSVPEEALSGYLNTQLSNRVVLLQALMKPKQ
jgi:hypothetical protein